MFSRYFVVSVFALATDWLCFIALSSILPLDAGFAAWVAYMIGGIVTYVLSRRHVFHSAASGRSQAREVALFVGSCALGALLTAGIVHVAAPVFGKMVAKMIAVVVSFVTLYWLRKLVVFHWHEQRVVAVSATQQSS
ncbi:GtrA family protein [Burkholderia guangdongensis]|uniref:GtrA family protein n=1 Tax=Burkholderia guangdongensis TaxID=1792500 RepID=UPI001FECBA6F|nr:GtrA family protein [Burkholderia guangdongensis]